MKRPSRRPGVALVLAVAVAVVATPIWETPALAADEPVAPRFGPVPEALGSFKGIYFGGPHRPGSAVVNGRLVFSAAPGGPEGAEPWVTDGTPEGTRVLADIDPGPNGTNPDTFVTFRGLVWFVAVRRDVGREWWVTDGTPEGTRLFADLYPGTTGTSPTDPVVVGDRMFFRGAAPGAGIELMVTDGNPGGTGVAADIRPGPDSGDPSELTAFGSRLAYGAQVADGVAKPFVTDGTTGSTSRLDTEELDVDVNPEEFTVVGDRVFFQGGPEGAGLGRELWSSRGLLGDARPVKDIWPGAGSSRPENLTNLAGRLYFAATEPATGPELWTSDGSGDGTQLVLDVGPSGVGGPDDLRVVGSTLHFSMDDGVHGREPWVSDGTAAGARLLADVQPGPAGSQPFSLGVIDGSHLFAAGTGSGREPWITDGTAAGTRMVADLTPGAGSSNPYGIGLLGKTLVFATRHAVAAPVLLHAVTVPTSATTVQRRKKPYSHQGAKRRRIVLRVHVSATTPLSGTVTLTRKGRVVGTAQLRDGRARVRVTKRLKAGKHRILVSYAGSVDAQSSSTRTVVKVRPKPRKR